MWAINARFHSFFRSISSPASPPPFPSIFPSNHAARPPRLLAGAPRVRHRLCLIPVAADVLSHSCFILYVPRILAHTYTLFSFVFAQQNRSCTARCPAAAGSPARRHLPHRLGREAPPPKKPSPSARVPRKPFPPEPAPPP